VTGDLLDLALRFGLVLLSRFRRLGIHLYLSYLRFECRRMRGIRLIGLGLLLG